MIEFAITLGLVISLLSYEVFGLAAGGMVVPGYIALQLDKPEKLLGLLIVSLLTYLIIKALAKFMLIYGRRQMVMCLLIGCFLAIISRHFFHIDTDLAQVKLEAVGWVIPGLLAHWYDKQGVFKTVSVVFVSSAIVRFVLILVFAGSLFPH